MKTETTSGTPTKPTRRIMLGILVARNNSPTKRRTPWYIRTKRLSPSSGAAIKAGSSATSHIADASTVSELPSNGRYWTQATTLQAGVSSVKTQPNASDSNSGRGQRGFGAQISVSGARPQQNLPAGRDLHKRLRQCRTRKRSWTRLS
jgi:hypothetical protein